MVDLQAPVLALEVHLQDVLSMLAEGMGILAKTRSLLTQGPGLNTVIVGLLGGLGRLLAKLPALSDHMLALLLKPSCLPVQARGMLVHGMSFLDMLVGLVPSPMVRSN